MARLEEHYREMQDIEFTVEEGTLYLLQTRTGKRTAAAALRIAVDMVSEGLLAQEEAVARVDPAQLDQLLHPMIDSGAEFEVAAKGLNASSGAATGRIVLDADRAQDRGSAGEAVILVRTETTPDDIHGIIEARGVLTAHGGMTSHAAVVARGMGKPCVSGCEALSDRPRARGASASGGTSWPRATCSRSTGAAGDVIVGEVPLVPPQHRRELRDAPRLGGRDPPPARAGERRHARGRGEGARVRRRGHRPLPDGAHVHGRGAPAARPGDDHGLLGGGAPCGAGAAASRSSRPTSRASSRRWPGCR